MIGLGASFEPALLNLRCQPHPNLLIHIFCRVSVPQQPTHKRAKQMPVMEKLGSRTLDDFGFTGSSNGCFMNPRNVDKDY